MISNLPIIFIEKVLTKLSVKWWLLTLIQCQQVSLPWTMVKKETLFSAKGDTAWLLKQHCFEITQSCYSGAVEQPWGQAPCWPDSSTLLLHGLLCSVLCAMLVCCAPRVLLCCAPVRHPSCLCFSWGKAVFGGKYVPGVRGDLTYITEFLPLVPDWCCLMQMWAPNH